MLFLRNFIRKQWSKRGPLVSILVAIAIGSSLLLGISLKQDTAQAQRTFEGTPAPKPAYFGGNYRGFSASWRR
ncbi:hypothetical protein HC931_02220 [Candidatus Gracilibacteria bacterium]|nr:hypothetical protein [Candidatus Gracilibacteria bacterium]NJM88433.1 hypothetical protein [Hydrococcus sp. RU_2_2]NJP19326.1 hypothetical protein [Hydrococcus sp. CRU_1_1]NJQ98235.1 hypothetical protein [Hydrococcus sp. CSU_1_8]